VENRTRTYRPHQNVYSHRGRREESFDCQLPPEARSELEGSPPSQTYRAQKPPPPPPAGSSVTPRAARPVQSESGRGSGIWLLLGLLGLPILLAMLSSPRVNETQSNTQPQSKTTEVRRALPPPVEVRRALPTVVRALLVTAPESTVSNPTSSQWQSVRFYDGTTVQACYQGELPSSAALPPRGRFIGEEWSTDNTSWIWMTPAGASFPSWVDP
jgi:hypothetical protein